MGKITRNLEAFTDPENTISGAWWALACLSLAIGAGVGWLCLFYKPHDLPSLGRQMFAVLVIVISLAPALLIKEPSEGRQP